MMTSRTKSDARSKTVDRGDVAQASTTRAAHANRPHIAAAAAIDELLASEARASLRRTRDAFREEPPKARIRINVPPVRIVAKQSQSPAWKAPFFSLAMVVGISTLISAGGIAYLFLRPQVMQTTSDNELRGLRDSVTQLRRQVAELTLQAATIRSANSPKPQVERVAVRELPREPLTQPLRATHLSSELAATTQATQGSDFTGSVQTAATANASAARAAIEGWRIRRAYDGTAVLEGKAGIVEVSPGQTVPTLGRIQEIKNEGGHWQVITSNGIITGK